MERARAHFFVKTGLIVGIALLFLWFGIQKTDLLYFLGNGIMTSLDWVNRTPDWFAALLPFNTQSITRGIGVIEILLGLSLFIPRIRLVSTGLIALYLISTVAIHQFSEIGIRSMSTLCMVLALGALLLGEQH
jgi:hypothetical protein